MSDEEITGKRPGTVVTVGPLKVTLGPTLRLESTDSTHRAIELTPDECAILHLLLHRYDRINPDWGDGETFGETLARPRGGRPFP